MLSKRSISLSANQSDCQQGGERDRVWGEGFRSGAALCEQIQADGRPAEFQVGSASTMQKHQRNGAPASGKMTSLSFLAATYFQLCKEENAVCARKTGVANLGPVNH